MISSEKIEDMKEKHKSELQIQKWTNKTQELEMSYF